MRLFTDILAVIQAHSFAYCSHNTQGTPEDGQIDALTPVWQATLRTLLDHRTHLRTDGPMSPAFFETAAEFRAWLEAHHETAAELWVGFHKTSSGKPSITWPEAVDEALCVGWIDGLRKSLGEESYMIRFTPRKPRSTWSAVNIGRVEALTREGRMHPEGLKAFEARTEANSRIYSHEQKGTATLDAEGEKQFRSQPGAWDFFHSQAPSYQKAAIWWVVSAKKDETRRKRLSTLIEDSANQRKLAHMTWSRKSE